MKTNSNKKTAFFWLLAGFIFIAGCSDDKAPENTQAQNAIDNSQAKRDAISADSPQDPTPEAEEDQKQKFEHDFAAKCVERELNNSQNQSTDADRVTKACDCIASYISKDLTDEEAKKFLSEHENPQSLRIKYEAGAYECLQEKQKPAEPQLNMKPQG